MAELVPGTKAPPATLPRLSGGEVALPGSSPLTLLAFYKASCPTCRWAAPFVQSLHAKTKGGSLAVVGVAEDDEDTARQFADELGLDFPIAVETEPWAVSTSYGLATVPTFFLVDNEGEILLTSPGFARDDLREVARRAAELSGGEPADPFDGADVPPFRPG